MGGNVDLTATLVQVARLYYEEELSQREIAERLTVSRSLIAFYIKKAREQGIVRIEIIDPADSCEHLAVRIQQEFGLDFVWVVPSAHQSGDLTRRAIGNVAAQHLDRKLRDGDVLGMGWGRTVKAVSSILAPNLPRQIEVVPLLGESAHSSSYTQINETVLETARSFSGHPFFLLAPMLPGTTDLLDALVRDPGVDGVVSRWDRLSVACVGIGAIPPVKGQFEVAEEGIIADLVQRRAAGDICFRYFDISGSFLETEFNGRLLGISADQLRQARALVAVAEGADKARALLGALRTELITDLFIDENLAQGLLGQIG